MAKKTDTTNSIDLAAIAAEDEALGRILEILTALPRPLPEFFTMRLLHDVKAIEAPIRQSAVDRRREAERRAADVAREKELQPARDALAAHAKTLREAGEMDLRPIDVDHLSDHAERAEIDMTRALAMAGLSEDSPAVQAWTAIRQRRKQSSRVIPFSPANVKR